MKTTHLGLCLSGTLLFAGLTAQANTVMVQEVSTSPTEIISGTFPTSPPYTGGAYAGVVNLKVDGVSTIGFCIDPFHFSNPSSVTAAYDVVNLASAPKSPAAMGAAAALEIEKLWGHVFSLNSTITAEDAAGLQVAIWQVVCAATGTTLSLNLADATTLLAANKASAFRSVVEAANYSGPTETDLVGLKSQNLPNGQEAGQDYVVRSVPDGGATLGLLGMGFVSLVLVRNRKNASTPAVV